MSVHELPDRKNLTNLMMLDRVLSKMDALIALVMALPEKPPNVHEALDALIAAQGAWPSCDIDLMQWGKTSQPRVIGPGRKERVAGSVPSDQVFLLRSVHADIEGLEGRSLRTCHLYLYQDLKWLADASGVDLGPAWLKVPARQMIGVEVQNEGTEPFALKKLIAHGYILMASC